MGQLPFLAETHWASPFCIH